MRKAIFVVLGALVTMAQAPTDPIMTNYRAYRAAVEAGDLAGAETAAHAAWDAASASDANGSRTGVLALNYAKVALANNHRQAALPPARQAAAIADSGGGGLDPVSARLALGRAELSLNRGEEGAGRILAALEEARNRAELGPDAFESATDLGEWALNEEHYTIAADAFGKAATFAGFSPGDPNLALGDSRTAEAVSLIALATSTEIDEWGRGIGATGSTIRGSDQRGAYQRAQEALVAAEEALIPIAFQPSSEAGLTVAQRSYAVARAWRTVINARLTSNNQNRLPEPDVTAYLRLPGSGPLCSMAVISEPMPRYPQSAANRGEFGAVVTRILTDENGGIRDIRVAAAIPDRFQSPVERVAPRWRVERAAGAPANCRVQPVIFHTIMFYIE